MSILHEQIVTTNNWSYVWLLVIFFAMVIGALIIRRMVYEERYGLASIVIVALAVISFFLMFLFIGPDIEKRQLKVIVEDRVDIYEFLDNYNIVKREGNILILEPVAGAEE